MAEAEVFNKGVYSGGVAARLREAREGAGLSLGDISARTRIAQRHLLAIEEGRFGDLASRTYAVGFARAFARTVGVDEQDIANQVRAEMAGSEDPVRPRAVGFEPGDPARVPGQRVAWLAAFGVIVLLGVIYATWQSLLAPAGELPSLLPDAPPTAPSSEVGGIAATGAPASGAAAVAGPPVTGPVVFTATAPDIWVKFYDGAGKQLMQKQMALGESYTVPAEAAAPQVWTGRPDALAITIGGTAVAPLASRQKIVKDVPVSAAALLARGAPAGGAGGGSGTGNASASAPGGTASAAPLAAATAPAG